MAKLNTWYDQSIGDKPYLLYQLDIRVPLGEKNRITITMPSDDRLHADSGYRDAETWVQADKIKGPVVNKKLGKEGKAHVIKVIFKIMAGK